jgi:hypothetical protein
MGLTRRRFLLSALSTGLAWPAAAAPAPLWPGSRYTAAQRQRAIQRGLDYIYKVTRVKQNFDDYGADFLWCFHSLSATAKDPWLRDNALRMGRERARVWRRENPTVPAEADADDISDLVFGCHSADGLGITDAKMRPLLQQAAAKFGPVAYLKYDPTKGFIPTDIAEPCGKCGPGSRRADTSCTECGGTPKMMSPYELLLDSLIVTWSGEHYGVKLGATFGDVAALIPTLRPYRGAEGGANKLFIDIAYAVTHIVYVLNDYGKYRLKPEWLPHEYQYLKDNFEHVIRIDDPETMGEFIDTLKSFGVTEQDPLIRRGIDFILSRQHKDGSWGDLDKNDKDPYTPYHSTWTAINGLMDYAFAGERVSFPEALKLANREKTT